MFGSFARYFDFFTVQWDMPDAASVLGTLSWLCEMLRS